MKKDVETEYLECKCSIAEHVLRFTLFHYDPKEGKSWASSPEVYVETYLNQCHNIFQRMWIAFKYVLNIGRSTEGHFDCCMLDDNDCEKLRDMMNKMVEEKKLYSDSTKLKS